MFIKIEPFDTLFFRNGKPYEAGSETYGESMFPPYPSVIYGALRTVYFSNHMSEFKLANTQNDPTNNLVIKNMYYAVGDNEYLPIPLDLVHIKNTDNKKKIIEERQKKYETICLRYHKLENSVSIKNISGTLGFDEQVEEINEGIIDIDDFEKYMHGNTKKIYAKRFSDYISTEHKTSIAIDRNMHKSEQAKLYEIPLKRLNCVKICVEFDGIDIPEKGIIKLGGEGKAAKYTKFDEILMNKPEFSGNYFKLYLSTPAVFENGWLPKWINTETLEGKLDECDVKLVTACIGKYICIGGFDMAKIRPKPMRRAVPAGSVYYFKVLKGSIDMAINKLYGKCISEFDTSKQGFGKTYIVRWDGEE